MTVTEIVDHSRAQSFYFRDPNGVSLEYSCIVRALTDENANPREITLPRAALGIDRSGNDAVT